MDLSYHVQFSNVAHGELVETVGQQVLGLGVGAVTDIWHADRTLEATADAAINTLGLAPRFGHTLEAVALMTLELGHLLLDDRAAHDWSHLNHFDLLYH
ncbi:hypothetical protein Ae201684_016368 [Aphanomyces euteiches]|uniref:Uncharacterized protein n=1 Tax=Aphanomyces euteiches TaxID=100861 RepID=A0A6G0WCX4_9STRA|nr:hypothetical protein Ae201684_016368 [Aphanomyces euteiches]